jgi:hypothetical protein
MVFEQPMWVILVSVLVLAGWLWPWLGFRRPLRMAALVLLIVVLMRPSIRVRQGGMELWALMDRSASAAVMEMRQGDEILQLLERERPSNGTLRVVDFGAEMRERFGVRAELRDGETRIGTGLEWVIGRRTAERATRILLVTDGHSTEPLDGIAAKAAEVGIPVDVRWLVDGGEPEVQLAQVEVASRVAVGEAFLVQGRVQANVDGAVPYEILRDGLKVGSGTVHVRRGRGLIRFSDRGLRAGPHVYEICLQPEKDRSPENNRGEGWVHVDGGNEVLVLSSFESDPVVKILEANGFRVRHLRKGQIRGAMDLAGVGLLVLNDFRADWLPTSFLKAVPFFVRERGGGLVMLGGRGSFASGGYHGSEVDPLMPVSMDVRDQQRKAALALAIMMDRSGSMGASPGGGAGVSGGLTKMDLANEGAANALGLLMPNDVVSVHAVDTTAHEVVGMSRVGAVREEMIRAVRSIRSEGGGIFIGEALAAGWEALRKVDVPVRHMILFADAMDSEVPGGYRETLREATAAGVTVSVIGLGTETDKDAELLKEVAALGRGRMFFQADAFGIPALFSQETMMVSQPAFVAEGREVVPTGGWGELASGSMRWLARIDAFNATDARDGATVALRGAEGDREPLVAFWQVGAGRTATVAFPVAGAHSDAARGWEGLPGMLTGLARWSSAGASPAGVDLGVRLRGNVMEVDLFYAQEHAERIAKTPPVIRGSDGRGEVVEGKWEKMVPGHFRTRMAVRPGEVMNGVVRAGGWTLPFGPVAVPASSEWLRDPASQSELRALVRATGGRERINLSGCWDFPERLHRERPLGNWLLAGWLVVVVVEALVTRLGWGRSRMT